MVECRYGQLGSHPESPANVSYMVKTPSSSLPSSVMSDGPPSSVMSAVQLRIATGEVFMFIHSKWNSNIYIWLELAHSKASQTFVQFLYICLVNLNRSDLFKLLGSCQAAPATSPWQTSVSWTAPAVPKTECSNYSQLLYCLPSLCQECPGAHLWRVRMDLNPIHV